MKYAPILLVDNGIDSSLDLHARLKQQGLTVLGVEDHMQACELVREGGCGAVLVNLRGCREWRDFFQNVSAFGAEIPRLAYADQGTVAEAVAALRSGASDYLERPLEVAQLTAALAQNGASGWETGRADAGLVPEKASLDVFANIIGQSEKIQQVFRLIRKIADSDTTVLIEGESGTGKELIARALHYEGVRARGPFVPVNCGAIPGELLESELFGHEKGAFTHAIRTRIGRFELADSGTVFLDEIAEMSPMLQVKILRVLQERRFERIGGTKTIHSDFRVIAATNRELEEEVRKGRFREDLYYRLNVIPVQVPPLRERVADIPLLVTHFIEKFNKSRKKTITDINPEVMAHLIGYSWPGNVRELENMVERMVILCGDHGLTLQDVPERLLFRKHERQQEINEIPSQGFFLNDEVASFEKRLLIQALNQSGWVKNRAANLLHINRTTLLEKLKKYELLRRPGQTPE